MELQSHTTDGSTKGSARSYPFNFTGNGKEFFGIWIVNILLIIVTLGLYMPWAKVKTQRYFYGNTFLNDHAFQYLADPWKIFKGRLIAIGVVILASVLATFFPIAGLVIYPVLIGLTPWMLNNSLRFNAVNSAYQNIRFDFKGNYWGAFMVFFVWPILAFVTLFILAPFWLKKLQDYVVNNSYYGQTKLHFDASVSEYYSAFIKAILMLIVVIIAIAALSSLGGLTGIIISGVLYLAALIVIQAYFAVVMANIVYSNTVVRANRFDSQMTVGSYLGVVAKNFFFTLLTLGLYYPWAKVNLANYRAQTLTLEATDLNDFIASERANVSALGDELGEAFDIEFSAI